MQRAWWEVGMLIVLCDCRCSAPWRGNCLSYNAIADAPYLETRFVAVPRKDFLASTYILLTMVAFASVPLVSLGRWKRFRPRNWKWAGCLSWSRRALAGSIGRPLHHRPLYLWQHPSPNRGILYFSQSVANCLNYILLGGSASYSYLHRFKIHILSYSQI